MGIARDVFTTRTVQRDQRIVGWSLFDCDRIVENVDVSDRAKQIVAERYVNAISIAKRWRRRFVPDCELEANELKAYFPVLGFKSTLPRGIDHTPAAWIGYVHEQVIARGPSVSLG